MHRHLQALTFTCILLGACGGGKNDSDTEASDSTAGATSTGTTAATDASASIGMSSTPTTSGADGSGSTNPTQVSGTTTDDTAGGTTTGATATTGADPDLMQLCESWCSKNAECQRSEPDGCAADCFAALGSAEAMCVDATTAMLNCMLGMTCEQLVAFTDDDDPGPCAAEFAAGEDACAGEVCTISVGSNEDNTECSYTVECPNEPSRELQCAGETCTCLEDGKQVGECPGPDACMKQDDLATKALDCCGFV
jgi:hypothetical protein